MSSPSKDVSRYGRVYLVIPAYNPGAEFAHFLPDLAEALAISAVLCAIQVVDDGSDSAGAECIQSVCTEMRAKYPFVCAPIRSARNQGKGAAIKTGWQAAPVDATTLVFVDADGSVSPSEVLRLILLSRAAPPNTCIVASRLRVANHRVQRKVHRHLIGRVFAWLTHRLVNLPVHDTQCGCKVVPTAAYQQIESTLHEDRFAFDVELLAALRRSGCEIVETPIDWSDRGKSTVRLVRDSAEMFVALWRIRARLKQSSRNG